jgi:large subunit ribosomal protein L41
MRSTQPLLKFRHLKLTTKDVNKGFYKGNRTGTVGRHTKHGGFIVDYTRVRTFVVPPNLKDFKVWFSCGLSVHSGPC